jgi:hypothetical protein
MAVVANYQVNGANPVTVGGTGTAAKYFTAPSGNFTSGVSTTPNATNATGQLNVDGDNQFNGQRFVIAASGDFEVGSGGACPSVTFDLQANTGTFIAPIYTTIATSGAITAQTNTNLFYPWQMTVSLTGTTAAGTLSGSQTWVVDNTVSANNGPLTNVLSGLNFLANPTFIGGPVFGLVMRVTFSVSEPGNKANLYQFQIEGN